MDLTGTQIKNTYGNVLTIGSTAGTPQTGTLQNGAGENITSATLTGGTVTTSNPLLDMTQTWNDAGVTFTSLKLNVTDTASASASLLLDLQVGGDNRFKVDKTGRLTLGGTGSSGILSIYAGDTQVLLGYGSGYGTQALRVVAPGGLSLSDDVTLAREAADILAQRRSTNAQTFNFYNTYTDASNYERGFIKWDTNVLKIGTEALGTGTLRGVKLGTASTSLIGFYDATAIVQPTTGVAEAAFVENSGGTAVNVDSTFGGYTIQQIAQALQSLGLLA